MQVEEAIRGRYSVKVFQNRSLAPGVIEQSLDVAIWAPNHKMTEPWYFAVVEDGARYLLAEVMERAARAQNPLAITGRETRKLLSAPALVAIYSDRGSSERTTMENYAATAAAVQNLLLVLHSRGLGAIWRTGSLYDEASVRDFLGVPSSALLVGAVFVGYAETAPARRRRTPAAAKTYRVPTRPAEVGYGQN